MPKVKDIIKLLRDNLKKIWGVEFGPLINLTMRKAATIVTSCTAI